MQKIFFNAECHECRTGEIMVSYKIRIVKS